MDKKRFTIWERSNKYCKDLKLKRDSISNESLSDTQLAYRSGYVKGRKQTVNKFLNSKNYKKKFD